MGGFSYLRNIQPGFVWRGFVEGRDFGTGMVLGQRWTASVRCDEETACSHAIACITGVGVRKEEGGMSCRE
jgi:hypothetical protein